MAIAFLVEDGTGLTAATSYVSVSDADDIIATNIHDTTWTALSTEDKQSTLIWASRLLDERVTWFGTKTVPTSGLRWPRTGTVDKDGVAIASNVVPEDVATATVELARTLTVEDPTVPADSDGIAELGVDVIKIKFDTNYVNTTFPSRISHIISSIGLVSGQTGFAKLVRV